MQPNNHILSRKDLNGKTIYEVKRLLQQGERLDTDAQQCFEIALHRVKRTAYLQQEIFWEEIIATAPENFSEDLRTEIYTVLTKLNDPLRQQLEEFAIMTFPEGNFSLDEKKNEAEFNALKEKHRHEVVLSQKDNLGALASWAAAQRFDLYPSLPERLSRFLVHFPEERLTEANDLLDFAAEMEG